MSYYNVDPRSLYDACRSQYNGIPVQQAMAWIEAENIFAVWKVVQAWFELMEASKAADRYPDPFWSHDSNAGRQPLTQELADRLIAELDADFEIEHSRFPQGLGPEFARLPPHARLAFAQEIYGMLKTEGEIEAEAVRRTRGGEKFPPEASS